MSCNLRYPASTAASLEATAAIGPLQGILCAALVMLIWAGYPVVTRMSVAQTLSPEDLFALRFGISALVFLPYLAWRAGALPGDAWLKGIGLALCQGTLAALVIAGLELAPARHASALVQGVLPAWVLIAGAVFLGRRFQRSGARGVALIAAGVAMFVAGSGAAFDREMLRGDLMFLLASLLACGYFLQTRRFRLPPAAAAAFVAVYSAVGFLPWYVLSAEAPFARVPAAELMVQVLYQGVLVGCVSFVALNRAIIALGSTRTSAFISAVPVLTALIAIPVLGEHPPLADCAALALITVGVGFAAHASQASLSLPPAGEGGGATTQIGPVREDARPSRA